MFLLMVPVRMSVYVGVYTSEKGIDIGAFKSSVSVKSGLYPLIQCLLWRKYLSTVKRPCLQLHSLNIIINL